MESLGKLQLHQQPNNLSFTYFSSSFPKIPWSFSFRSLPRSTPSFKCASIRASSSKSQDTGLPVLQSLPSRILESTYGYITFTAAVALFFVNLQLNPPRPIAAPVSAEERSLEEDLASHPDDVEALCSLMEVRIKYRRLIETIELIERLIELEPEEKEWPILKANIFSYSGDLESAKSGFEEILAKDPLRVEAYRGLVMAYSDSDSGAVADLIVVKKRIEEAMVRCKKEKKGKELRDFMLLVAQIRVIERKRNEALKLYEMCESHESQALVLFLLAHMN